MQRQAAVTVYFSGEQLLLFAFAHFNLMSLTSRTVCRAVPVSRQIKYCLKLPKFIYAVLDGHAITFNI